MELQDSDLERVQNALSRIVGIGGTRIRDMVNKPEYVYAEADHIHNLASYMIDRNLARHAYYWNSERPMYLDKVNRLDVDAPPSITIHAWNELWEVYEKYNKILPPEHQFEPPT